jgi:hypothetical protein
MFERLSQGVNQRLTQLLQLPAPKGAQICVFFWLACFVLLLNVVNYTIASALFLEHLGTVSLAVSYIIIGCLTLPLYSAFARVVDAYPRPQLFRLVVLAMMILSVGLWLGLIWEIQALYFVLYISAYFLWVLLQDLFASLAYDYFTVLEVKQLFPKWGVGMALGEVLAALLTTALVSWMTTRDLLLILPVLGGVVMLPLQIVQTQYLPLTATAANIPESTARATVQQKIQDLSRLGKRYWIIPFLVGSALLHATLYCLGEFLYFQVYVDTFTSEQQLTQFLAVMRGINNVVQILLLTLITPLLLQKIKVGKLNLIYPFLNLLMFMGLRWQFSLPLAMLVNAHNDAFNDGLDKPIFTLNYNAVPHRYLGRIQSLAGVFDAFGLMLGGILLSLPFAPVQLTEIALGLGGLLLLLRYGTGRGYSRSMLALLSPESMAKATVSLTSGYQSMGIDRDSPLHGLLDRTGSKGKLSTRLDQIYQYLRPDYEMLSETLPWLYQLSSTENYQLLKLAIANAHQRLLRQVLYCLAQLGDQSVRQVLLPRLQDDDPRLRANAIELLLTSPYRRLVAPLLPLLEPVPQAWPTLLPEEIVSSAQQSKDAWIRLAAQMLNQRPESHCIYQIRSLHLKRLPLFSSLSLEQIHHFAADFEVRNYTAKTVFVLSEPALYLIYTGQCLLLSGKTAQESLPPPHWVIERQSWLIGPADRMTLKAIQTTTMLQLPQIRWERLTKRYPELRENLQDAMRKAS